MAAPDFSAAAALAQKAGELVVVGHLARAAAKLGQAAESARAQRCPDCLVVARLQLDHAVVASNALEKDESVTGAEYKARRRALLVLYLAAAATIQRRRAAGTLLGATCTAAELAWQQLQNERSADLLKGISESSAAPELAELFGYETGLLCAVGLIDEVLLSANHPECFVMTAEQLRDCWTFIADTVELMAQPRAFEHVSLSSEGNFVTFFRILLNDPHCILSRDGVGARLRNEWQRLESSGLLQRRRTDQSVKTNSAVTSAVTMSAAAAANAPGLRCCALASCSAREAHPAHFKSCAACRGVAYCSKEHQTEHWPSHKAACKAARKAAEQTTTPHSAS